MMPRGEAEQSILRQLRHVLLALVQHAEIHMAPSNADRLVVDAHFQEFCETEYPGEDIDDVFEKYAAIQVLKPRDLSSDELSAGIVDGGADGGIDSLFVFLNGILLSPDSPFLVPGNPSLRNLAPHPELTVFLIQSKNRNKWEESVWEHLLSSLAKLLDSGAKDAELEKMFKPAVVERTGILRKAVRSLGPKFPKFVFRLVYVTKAPEPNLTPSISAKGDQVRLLVESLLTTGAEVTAEHVGIRGLYILAGTDYSEPATLVFRSLIRERGSFVGVASISDYLAFIRDKDTQALREELFDYNVRDFEGDNLVNEAIGQTLVDPDDVEFWWLNNGVTVIGDQVDSPQQTLTISRPLIVNGLQTSYVLDRADRENTLHPDRLTNGIVVRVIASTDEETRDRIIAGTNRQTQVPGPALFATQPRQREIENFLKVHNWYYERRKNRYKNQGMPAKRRVTMGLLAQALITLLLAQPDVARARPSTLLSRRDGYESIFPESLDLDAYLAAIEILSQVDEFLKGDDAKTILDEFTNARFYVLAGYAITRLRIKDPSNLRFGTNYHRLAGPVKKAPLVKALTILAAAANSFQQMHPGMARDAVFKNPDFREEYFSLLTSPSTSIRHR
ncbi:MULTISPECIES: AIPR family protein [unclassified Micromonospora]|uniref:AIPR family protein n=1 Tax=unclassified Micromonospora TaxID=2617518 RepID=UPI00331A1AF3